MAPGSQRLGLHSSNLPNSFEARNNPNNAPLAAWFNGGPGCSSMIGLFQENGPCRFENGESTPSLNPYSWNNYANMLYIDQPIGVGFSYGNDPVTSTLTAAPYVWKLIQAFYDQFPKYENREFGIWTESYGGRTCYKPSLRAARLTEYKTMDLHLPTTSMNRMLLYLPARLLATTSN